MGRDVAGYAEAPSLFKRTLPALPPQAEGEFLVLSHALVIGRACHTGTSGTRSPGLHDPVPHVQ